MLFICRASKQFLKDKVIFFLYKDTMLKERSKELENSGLYLADVNEARGKLRKRLNAFCNCKPDAILLNATNIPYKEISYANNIVPYYDD